MRNRTGMNTSVVFGFVKFLRDILKRENPDLLGVAFDPKGGSFRRELYPEYKANRPATPEDIALSIPYIKRILDAMCVPVLEVEGFEADDVIGTLSQKAAAEGYEVFMVTPDKDYGQLVRPLLQALQAEGRRHRDRRLRRHPRTLRIRRSDARARRAGVVGRCLGQYSRRAGHRREGCLQAGADVGNGREHSLQRGADQRAGRARASPRGATNCCLPRGSRRSGWTCRSNSAPRS